jgi:outer membrane protein OmpA-like peptidoglycan-associated protein
MHRQIFLALCCAALLQFATVFSALAAPTGLAAPPLPFEEAVVTAVSDLFSGAVLRPGSEKIEVVIDPLIDGATAAQTTATQAEEKRVVEFVKRSFPRFEVRPFTPETLARLPVVLVGTLTPIKNVDPGAADPQVYRVCFAMADLRSKTIIAKGARRAKPQGVDHAPLQAFADSPVWAADPSVEGYIKTCQASKLGETVDAAYVAAIGAAALVSEAVNEYEAKHYREALAYYRVAMRLPGGDQLRVRNGLYLTTAKLNRRDESVNAFGEVVDYSLKASRLSVRFLFKPGSTQFHDDKQVTGPYPMWLSQIATRAFKSDSCLDIVGHTSPTGPAALNERLSVLRAQYIKGLLQSSSPQLGGRLTASGVGLRENLVGTGKDDASDAIDRRVEFKVRKC